MTSAAKGHRTSIRAVITMVGAFLLTLSQIPAPAYAANADGFTIVSVSWGTPTSPAEAAPGTYNVPFTVVMQYYYYNQASGMSVQLSLPPGFTDLNGNSFITQYVPGTFASGAIITMTFYLNLSPRVVLGAYPIAMTINWGAIIVANPFNPILPIQSESMTQNTQVNAIVKGKVQLQFAAADPNLNPGNVTEVPLLVSNIGTGTASNVTLSFSASTSSLTTPGASVLSVPAQIESVGAGSTATTYVEVYTPASSAGQASTLTVTASYVDAYGYTRSASGLVGFHVSSTYVQGNIALSGYTYQPTLIYPGTTVASLQVVLVNLGTTPTNNMNVSLTPTGPLYAISPGSLSWLAGLLPAGQSVPITFAVGIRNSSQPENGALILTVKASGAKTQTFVIPFVEQPKANFQVVSVSSAPIYSGDGFDQITVTLRNSGQAAAQLTTFAMQPSYVFEPSTQGSFTSTPNTGIGTVTPGKTTNLTIIIQVNSNLQQASYPLVLHATWTQQGAAQPFGQDIVLMLPVKSSAFQVANSYIFSIPVLIAIVVLIAAALVTRSRRRARRRREATSA